MGGVGVWEAKGVILWLFGIPCKMNPAKKRRGRAKQATGNEMWRAGWGDLASEGVRVVIFV